MYIRLLFWNSISNFVLWFFLPLLYHFIYECLEHQVQWEYCKFTIIREYLTFSTIRLFDSSRSSIFREILAKCATAINSLKAIECSKAQFAYYKYMFVSSLLSKTTFSISNILLHKS